MSLFVVPKPEGEKPENQFQFKVSRKAYRVPFIQYLSGDASEFLSEHGASMTEVAIMRRLIAIECPDAEEEVRKLSNDQMLALSAAWAEASNGTVGESEASEES